MKHSYLLAGITSGKLIKLILRNGLSIHPKILLRFLFLLQNGFWASFFKRREKIKFRKALLESSVPDDPVIIIGHWRSGSTLLHQLMSLDKNLIAPTVFQVSLPDSFLVSEKFYRPVMSSLLNKTRPMDNVKLGFNEPQEDEYALLKLTNDSPLEDLIFHKRKGYFLKHYANFDPNNNEAWQEALILFCKKLVLLSGKRILLKNPFHSLRLNLLKEIFPNAKFIHIHRHPYKVVPSTINLWNIIARQNRLNGKWTEPTLSEVAEVMSYMMNNIRSQLSTLRPGTWTELSFETLEKDPVSSLRKLYAEIGLGFTKDFEQSVLMYLAELKNYRKNVFILTDENKMTIRNILKDQFDFYGYDDKNYNEACDSN